MNNLERAIKNAVDKLPESGQPEQLRNCLEAVIDALVVIKDELMYRSRSRDDFKD